MNPASAKEEGMKLVQTVFSTFQLNADTVQPNLGILEDWDNKNGLIASYLNNLSPSDNWPEQDREKLSSCIHKKWSSVEEVALQLSTALLRLGQHNICQPLAEKLKNNRPNESDTYALLAILALKARDLPTADKYLRETLVQNRLGTHPWLLFWMHCEFSGATAGLRRYQHWLCSILTGNQRLPPREDLQNLFSNSRIIQGFNAFDQND